MECLLDSEAVALRGFLTRLHTFDSHFDSIAWDDAVIGLTGAIQSLPGRLRPLEWWTVRGLVVDAVERLIARFNLRLPFELEFRREVAHASCAPEIARALRMHLGVVQISSRSAERCDPRVQRALEYIWANCTRGSITLDDVAATAGLSRWHMSRLLVRHTGMAYRDLLRSARIVHAQPLLLDGDLTVKEIAAGLGYAYATEFNRQFHRTFGLSPTEWRIKYTTCSLVPTWVFTTPTRPSTAR